MDPNNPTDPQLPDPPVDPALVAPPVEPPAPEPTPEPPAPEPPQPDPNADHGNKGKTPWFMRELATKDAELAEAKRRADAAEELARRLQNGNQPPNPNPPPAQNATEAEINARATQIAIARDVAELDRKGMSKFGGGWSDTVATLNAAGANKLDFMEDVMAADRANAHELLHTLATEPEKLITIARLPQAQRIAELTRISMGKSAPAAPVTPPAPPKTVSRAPAPPPPLNPGGKKAVDWRSDDASDAEFDQGFQEMMQRRSGGRR